MSSLTARQLAATLAVRDHDVNPRTGEVAFTWDAPGFPMLFGLRAGGGAPYPLVAEQSQYGLWSLDGRTLAFLRDEGGREAEDVMLLDTVTGLTRNLTDDDFAYGWPRFAPDGTLAAISNRAGNFDPYLYEAGAWQRVVTSEAATRGLAWSPDGQWLGWARLAAADVAGNIQFSLHAWERATGTVRDLATLGGDFFEAEFHWQPGADPAALVIAADHGEFQDLRYLTVEGEQRWLTEGPQDKSQARWSPDGRLLAFVQDEWGNERLRLFVPEAGVIRELSIGDGVHRQPRWAPDGESLTVIFEGATEPPDLWRVPLVGDPQRLTHSLPDGFPRAALTPSTAAAFPTWDGRTVHSLLYTPSEPNGAALVWVHGGPTSSHRNHWFADIQLLCSAGYTVLAPNVRGSTGYGRTFRDLNRYDWGGGDLRDLAAAHDFLGARGFGHVGILGGSYGGYLVLMALTRQPERWGAGAALFPIANLHTLYESSRPSDLRPYLVDQIGTPDARADFYRDRSPVHFVEQVAAPLLLLQGANDIRTPLAEAQSMAERLAAARKPHRFHVYPDEGHGFQHRATREDAMNRVIEFFNSEL